MGENHYELFFETLANPLRMRILLATLREPLSVKEITGKVGKKQSKVSHALNVLKACSLVRLKVEGRSHRYEANRETVVPLLKLADAHSCKNCGVGCGDAGCKQAERKTKRGGSKAAGRKAGAQAAF